MVFCSGLDGFGFVLVVVGLSVGLPVVLCLGLLWLFNSVVFDCV